MGRGYSQFCPVAKAAEVFAERWTPLILRELLLGSHRFNELRQGMPLVSQSLLTGRLRSLEREGIVERRLAENGRTSEYHLTPTGEEFRPIVELLGAWGYRWAIGHLKPGDLDAETLMWFFHRRILVDKLPEHRVVVRFQFRDDPHRFWWLVLERPTVDLCLRDEGFDVDLFVTADLAALTHVYLGLQDLAKVIANRLIEIEGPRTLARAFQQWIGITAFAPP